MITLVIILAVSLLVIVHEFGHYLVARAFGMRVITYSIGFGPALARWRPRGSETVFQVAALPILAYVHIAGMNPRDPVDPNDRGSYQNASALARFMVLAAGPFANYLAACVLLFLRLWLGGTEADVQRPWIGRVEPRSPAAAAGIRPGDIIRSIDGQRLSEWSELPRRVVGSQGRTLTVELERDHHPVVLRVTPRPNPQRRQSWLIGVAPQIQYVPVAVSDAAAATLVRPAQLCVANVRGLYQMLRGREKLQVMGPVLIVAEASREAEHGWREAVATLALVSLALCVMNLVPIPAFDGGRLVFLLYEMVRRRKAPPVLETYLVAFSMVLVLVFGAAVTVHDIYRVVNR
jgi:regulator of sigma E protease